MFCPHSVFMCFVWIWEQTAIISLYSINRDGVCLLRDADWAFKHRSGLISCSMIPTLYLDCFVSMQTLDLLQVGS